MMRSVFFGMLLVASTYTFSLRDISAMEDTPDQGIICDICEFVGDEVNKRILTDQTKDQIIAMTEVICDDLPYFAAECKKAVEDHGKDALDYLFSMLDVQTICAEIHLCTSKNELPSFFRIKDSEACTACMDGLNLVKMIIDSDEITELLNIAIDEICMAAGSTSGTCVSMTSKIIDEILANLRPMFKPDSICKNAGACPALLTASNDDGCLACKDGFQIIKNILTSSEVSELIDIAVNETCVAMGGGVEVCEKLAGNIFHEILTNLMKDFLPGSICSKLGACPAHNLESLGDGEGCQACVDALDIVDQILKSPSTLGLVHIAVDEICISIGGDVATCETAIKGILDPIINNLVTLFNPQDLCKQSGACPSLQLSAPSEAGCLACSDSITIAKRVLESFEMFELLHLGINKTCAQTGPAEKQCIMILTVILDNMNQQLLPLINPHNICVDFGACAGRVMTEEEANSTGLFCDACKDGILELHNIAQDNETDLMAEELTTILCNVVKIPFCKAAMLAIVKEALQDVDDIDPDTACTSIGACSADLAVAAPVENIGDTCSECVSIADEIISLIKNDQVDSLIKEAIGELCTLLPIANCEATIDGYFDEIIALLKNLDGKTLCSLIGLCSSPEIKPVLEMPVLGFGDTCSECTMIFDMLLKELKDPTVQAQVEAALDEVCTVLPISNCKDTIHSYMVMIEQLIDEIDGETLCSAIGLCSANY